jgi:hypothetical protein
MAERRQKYPWKWVVIGALWLFAVGVVLFWVSFFGGGAVHASSAACYLVFERNFFAADIFTALAGLVCAEGLRRGREWARVWGGVAAGGILFLGFMDVSYNLLNGLYDHVSTAMIMENGINVYCFTVGPFLIWYLLRRHGVDAHA